ncbi:MAG: glycosyltransferase family 2 protein [Pyramidobacter sp.]|jgi:glycosyltransferase involved in cell wall biosynthesis
MGSKALREQPLLSVVFPTHNAEEFVEKAIRSVAEQDYPNVEILLVDDASTDRTAYVAQKTLASCGRPFHLIRNPQNRGVSAARNTGLDAAQGELLCFLDADDFVEPGYLTKLYETISAAKADLAFCGYNTYFVTSGKKIPVSCTLKKTLLTSEDALMAWHRSKHFPSVWGFLYRREFLVATGIRFHEGCRYSEDGEFIQKTLARSSRVAFTRACLYNYVQHEKQITVVQREDQRDLRLQREIDMANERAARYVQRHSPSVKVRALVTHLQRPQNILRPFTFYARRKDWKRYSARLRVLRYRSVRHALWGSFFALLRAPEVFFKCVTLLLFPRVYYALRAKQFPPRRTRPRKDDTPAL